MLTFNAIDVETANSDYSSICQIGIVHIRNGEYADSWQTLINPETSFSSRNVSIHTICKSDVQRSPTLPEVRDELRRRLHGSVLVSHMPFDRIAFERAMTRYDLEQLQVAWLDSAKISRLAWPDKYSQSGYALKNIAKDLGISFRHHEALEDARVAAEIVMRACAVRNTDIKGWQELCIRPSTSRSAKPARSLKTRPIIPNEDGPLYGETIAFTGTLNITKREAGYWAADAGCMVVENVSRKVTILVVGTQDHSRLKGHKKSRSHRKADELNSKGWKIEILSEEDFFE